MLPDRSKVCFTEHVCLPERIHHVQGTQWLFPGLVAVSPDNDPHTPLPAPNAVWMHVQIHSWDARHAHELALMRGTGKGKKDSQRSRKFNEEVMETGDNTGSLTGALVISSTCGHGQGSSTSCRHSSHSLGTHVVAAAFHQPCDHGTLLLPGHGECVCDGGVCHSDSVEVKRSTCTVPSHGDRRRVHIR